MQDDNDPTIEKTLHRNHLVEYYPKDETLPPTIEDFGPMGRHHDDHLAAINYRKLKIWNNAFGS